MQAVSRQIRQWITMLTYNPLLLATMVFDKQILPSELHYDEM